MAARTMQEILEEAARMHAGTVEFKERFKALVVDYVELTGIAPSRFGRDSCRDGMLYDTVVGATRPGRKSVSVEKMNKVLAWMADPANSLLR